MKTIHLNVQKREEIGTSGAKKLRAQGLVPGVFYAQDEEPVAVVAKANELQKVVDQAGTSALVDMELDGKTTKILFKEIQEHPFKNQLVHFDAYGVNLKEKIKLFIPVVLENRDDIHVQPSVLLHLLEEVEVECLPTSLPSEAVVDVQNMEIGDTVTVADLDVSSIEGIEVLTDAEEAVAALQEPREEVIEEEDDEAEAADVPTVEETEDEGEDEE
ncbi:ribosomal protein L25, Ctc-form [Aedoeadaptatus nemausensis]|uniref:Large ribosomal subunit protein bL25 n=1 Tax=Aedoeadaptatus nemausensis TaxID=2582829 RepID=A0A6V6Y3K2_9FIRM|nr:50S ribosomal protein L25 [Peptoniphilus nemausensis]CAC9931191.1 ribosomal protein L25, Ctc-form [Peptoniphilus nemausensis]